MMSPVTWKDLNSSQFGPFGMMDMFGLDVVRQAWQEKDSDSSHLMHKDKIVDFLLQYTDKNYLGLKTFRGFYNYKDIDINYKKAVKGFRKEPKNRGDRPVLGN